MAIEFTTDNGNTNPDARNIIRVGYVSAVYPERNTVRVTFPDKNNLVSGELQILTPFAGTNKFYSLPDVNENVVVAMSGNDDSGGTGFILGSVFSEKVPPNSNNADETRLDFADGTSICYNRENHKLDINAAGDLTISVKGNVKISAEGNIDISAQGDMKLTANRIDLN